MTDLSIETWERDGVNIVVLSGHAGFDSLEWLEEILMPLATMGHACIVFDLRSLEFISSLVLGLLNDFRKGVVRHGGRVVLVGPSDELMQILERTRLTDLFPIVERQPRSDRTAVC